MCNWSFSSYFSNTSKFCAFFVLFEFVCDLLSSNSSCESILWNFALHFDFVVLSLFPRSLQFVQIKSTRLKLRLNFNTSMNHHLNDEHCSVSSLHCAAPATKTRNIISTTNMFYICTHFTFCHSSQFCFELFFFCIFYYPVQFSKLNIVFNFKLNSIHQFACFTQFVSRLILSIYRMSFVNNFHKTIISLQFNTNNFLDK